MRGSLMTALRRWTSTPDADGDLLNSSPRSGALSTGAAAPLARLTDAPVGETEFSGARLAMALPSRAPRALTSDGATGAGAVGLGSVGGATDGPPGDGGATVAGGCVEDGGWTDAGGWRTRAPGGGFWANPGSCNQEVSTSPGAKTNRQTV